MGISRGCGGGGRGEEEEGGGAHLQTPTASRRAHGDRVGQPPLAGLFWRRAGRGGEGSSAGDE
jgi:hypothetical protein